MAIPQSFLQELLARADIVDIVGRYVKLKKGGANLMGLCPFHGEKSPSFSVSPTKQFFHCFGCGKHGNAIGFLMEHTGMGFVEAVQDLAQQYGLQVPQDEASPQDRERAAAQRQKQVTLSDVLEKAGEAYRKHLKGSPTAIEYLKGRGLTGEIARRFGLGYAPEGWRSLASVFAHYDDPLLAESGLVIVGEEEGREAKRYDRFRDRIMFPIRNFKGECIGFGGRVLGDGTPKYLNSPETPVFSKGRELYGLFEARQALRDAGYVLVTEGYMDVVALAQLGFENAVATLGTACTTDHVQKLFRFSDAVVFSFDGDAAGRRAARKALDAALPYASDTRSIKFLFLPPEHDPDSFIRAHGADAFAAAVSEAVPLSRFLVDAARESCDLSAAEGRARMLANARPLWSALPDGALRRQLLAELADLAALDPRALADLWGERGASASSRPRPRERQAAADTASFAQRRTRNRPASRADHAARLLLCQHEALQDLGGELQALLADLPEPHGPLFRWLEAQLHEHGPQPWAALRAGLQDHVCEAIALKVMRGFEGPLADELPPEEARAELQGVLDLMLIDQLKQQESEALAAHDLARYQEVHTRRKALSGLAGAPDPRA
jgi:DNA primase